VIRPTPWHGPALDLSVMENLMMREFADEPYTQRGMLSLGAMRAHSEELVGEYDIRTRTRWSVCASSPGGNQQKAVLAGR
jgi:simple sugar transport system ATP-binding protein